MTPESQQQGVLGLSPRVRGKLVERLVRANPTRSIPACAGEAVLNDYDGLVAKVYPRVCGGSVGTATCHWICSGLSPRVRGKLVYPPPHLAMHGSIPACAGEASRPAALAAGAAVYPRVCGGSAISTG